MQLVNTFLAYVFGAFTFTIFVIVFLGLYAQNYSSMWIFIFILPDICSKTLDLTLEFSVNHVQCPYSEQTTTKYDYFISDFVSHV